MEVKPIPHPCVRNCCLDQDDICVGCYRHVDEILAWQATDNKGKRLILQNALKRKNKKYSKKLLRIIIAGNHSLEA